MPGIGKVGHRACLVLALAGLHKFPLLPLIATAVVRNSRQRLLGLFKVLEVVLWQQEVLGTVVIPRNLPLRIDRNNR